METAAILVDDKAQYQREQDKVLKTILDLRFFNPWRGITTTDADTSLVQDSNLELYITAKCNQKCSYCYLQKYPELYPAEYEDPKLIIKNLKILYDYIVANNFHIPEIDMFSGEIWHTDFGREILEITLEYIKKGMQFDLILIASNCYFVNNDESFHKMQNIIDQFNLTSCRLAFSISVDGKIVDNDGRPRNSNELYSDAFYDKLFAFAKHNAYYFHPMLAASNILKWKENYEWWDKMHKYYQLDIQNMMMLEVRNDDWTDETIAAYCEFIEMLADIHFKERCKGDIATFAASVASIRLKDDTPRLSHYIPWLLNRTDTYLGCTLSNMLTVRLGDLALCPCHRQAYERYLFGHYVVENDTIVDISASNPYMAVNIFLGNIQNLWPNCSMCIYNKCCLHGCMGSQLEHNQDPFFPIEAVCKFFKAKYSHILQYYRKVGLIDYLKTISCQEFNTEMVYFILEMDKVEREVMSNGMGAS